MPDNMDKAASLEEAIELLKMLWTTNPVAEDAGWYDTFAERIKAEPNFGKESISAYRILTYEQQERLRQFYKKVGVLKK